MSESDVVVFGYVTQEASDPRASAAELAATLSRLAKLEVALYRASTYAELTERILRKQIDLAWLPPVPYIALSRRDAAEPLVSLVRDGHAEFYAVLLVRSDSDIQNPRDLVGRRAAWVDPHSASGYVLPRIGLSAVGLDPRTAFKEERFHRSHQKVVRAVIEKSADLGATFGGLDAAGALVRGPWSAGDAANEVRVLATFGVIPPDVIAARSDLPAFACESLTHAFVHATQEEQVKGLLTDLFGASVEFKRGTPEGYLEFCRATMRASEQGLLQGEERN